MKIKISNLHKSFGENKVLEGVNLELKEKESFVILGRSGIGKSVLIKTIIGLMNYDSGEILVDNINIKNAVTVI